MITSQGGSCGRGQGSEHQIHTLDLSAHSHRAERDEPSAANLRGRQKWSRRSLTSCWHGRSTGTQFLQPGHDRLSPSPALPPLRLAQPVERRRVDKLKQARELLLVRLVAGSNRRLKPLERSRDRPERGESLS